VGIEEAGMLERIAAIPIRIVNYYTGQINKNTIEYWQRFIFYVIALSGVVAGTLAIIPSATVVFLKGQFLGGAVLITMYGINMVVVFSTRTPIKLKTIVIAFNFYLFGVASLILAGPEGESGIFFSVSVLLCSLFIGLRISFLAACLNLLTGVFFGILHANGFIGWDILRGFPFTSWLLQSANIFLFDMVFVIANTILIRGVGNTFTTLNMVEERIRASLGEKETLIRELYHRSKNNMQVVSSLLMLHSAELHEETAKAVFKDVINKIGAMSLVHQKLYESHDLSNINMAEYIRDLVALLMKSYGISPDKVEMNMDLENISMLIDTAIPCGLVVSEIIANALKYAFPENRTGRIHIGLAQVEDDFVELRITDNGVGVAPGFEVATYGKMGMKTLFTIVTHQLQGTIQFSSSGGVAFWIRFKRKLYDERVWSNG
jgi:two-component sensor histidine kinase